MNPPSEFGYPKDICDVVIRALLSFLRALVLQGLFVLVLPEFFGLDGVWSASVCTEIAAALLAALFLIRNNKEIHYIR